jgi:predicted aldo/keto reductase-like oxidoreductase
MATIPIRQLGKNGPRVPAIGLGAMGLSAYYGTPASDEERFKVFDRAIELGSTYIDTADVYGDSEDLLGKYFRKYPQQREKVSENSYDTRFKPRFMIGSDYSCSSPQLIVFSSKQ